MSFNVLVIPERFTHDQGTPKPTVSKLSKKASKAKSSVEPDR